ncbi:MAG TPA: antitoxin [Thermoanaerobaculia bacterium]
MRTTLAIDDDVLEAARSLSEAAGKSLGEVISELARRGLAPRPQEAEEEGFPVFSVSREARPITLEIVQKALEEAG